MSEKIEVENINCPGKLYRVDKEKYLAMKKTLLEVVPKKKPGLTQKELFAEVKKKADKKLWPGGEKTGWWAKTAQLDLEAKGFLQRTDTKPITWFKLKSR